ncbi:MAG TPA: pilus assembly PilX N-terminal domain-containing protein [Candidatus Saccharimonadales bacterium]|nr:pilus assembly PilX N-terminal domain-containing protein [Candidatus Saccharimonadales bacterium]
MISKLLSHLQQPRQAEEPEQGLVLISVVLALTALMIVGFALLSSTASQSLLTSNDTYSANALYVAEAGVEQSLQQLNVSDSFSGYPTPQQFFNNQTQGVGTFTTTVTNDPSDSNARIITSTGKVYRYHNASSPVSTKIVRVTAVGTSSQGYSVQSGPGGLILGGSAAITNSSVYVGGTITMTGAAHIGTTSQPLTVDVGNYACVNGGTYPALCSGTQPISLAWSTYIYGSVCATGQTSVGPGGNEIQGGNGGSGLEPNCTAPPASPPTYDRSAQIAAVTTTKASNDSSVDCTQYLNNGQGFNRTWPANLEITGNIDIGSSCNLVITGNVYITGNLTIDGAAKITVANSVGTTRPVILVDGTINVGGSAQVVANSSGTGLELISFCSKTSSRANCTDPSTLTGTALQASSAISTVTVGGAAKVPGVIFDAYWGKVTLGGSGNMGSAIGQTIDMSGAGTITFGTTLSSGARTWTISSYQEGFPYQY